MEENEVKTPDKAVSQITEEAISETSTISRLSPIIGVTHNETESTTIVLPKLQEKIVEEENELALTDEPTNELDGSGVSSNSKPIYNLMEDFSIPKSYQNDFSITMESKNESVAECDTSFESTTNKPAAFSSEIELSNDVTKTSLQQVELGIGSVAAPLEATVVDASMLWEKEAFVGEVERLASNQVEQMNCPLPKVSYDQPSENLKEAEILSMENKVIDECSLHIGNDSIENLMEPKVLSQDTCNVSLGSITSDTNERNDDETVPVVNTEPIDDDDDSLDKRKIEDTPLALEIVNDFVLEEKSTEKVNDTTQSMNIDDGFITNVSKLDSVSDVAEISKTIAACDKDIDTALEELIDPVKASESCITAVVEKTSFNVPGESNAVVESLIAPIEENDVLACNEDDVEMTDQSVLTNTTEIGVFQAVPDKDKTDVLACNVDDVEMTDQSVLSNEPEIGEFQVPDRDKTDVLSNDNTTEKDQAQSIAIEKVSESTDVPCLNLDSEEISKIEEVPIAAEIANVVSELDSIAAVKVDITQLVADYAEEPESESKVADSELPANYENNELETNENVVSSGIETDLCVSQASGSEDNNELHTAETDKNVDSSNIQTDLHVSQAIECEDNKELHTAETDKNVEYSDVQTDLCVSQASGPEDNNELHTAETDKNVDSSIIQTDLHVSQAIECEDNKELHTAETDKNVKYSDVQTDLCVSQASGPEDDNELHTAETDENIDSNNIQTDVSQAIECEDNNELQTAEASENVPTDMDVSQASESEENAEGSFNATEVVEDVVMEDSDQLKNKVLENRDTLKELKNVIETPVKSFESELRTVDVGEESTIVSKKFEIVEPKSSEKSVSDFLEVDKSPMEIAPATSIVNTTENSDTKLISNAPISACDESDPAVADTSLTDLELITNSNSKNVCSLPDDKNKTDDVAILSPSDLNNTSSGDVEAISTFSDTLHSSDSVCNEAKSDKIQSSIADTIEMLPSESIVAESSASNSSPVSDKLALDLESSKVEATPENTSLLEVTPESPIKNTAEQSHFDSLVGECSVQIAKDRISATLQGSGDGESQEENSAVGVPLVSGSSSIPVISLDSDKDCSKPIETSNVEAVSIVTETKRLPATEKIKSSTTTPNVRATRRSLIGVESVSSRTPSVGVSAGSEDSSRSRGRGRPKRNAARAANSKIKSLVLGALETAGLEEVDEPMTQQCAQCKRTKLCRFVVGNCTICSEDCHAQFLQQTAVSDCALRLCAQCRSCVNSSGMLSWETMDFCKEECLALYQTALGSNCVNCGQLVPVHCMGKFCVRFGSDIKQFCAPSCLEEHKKGLKVCSYCQKDISSGVEGFLAPVGDKGQFKEFCTQACMGKYEAMNGTGVAAVDACAVCSDVKPVAVEVLQGAKLHTLCSELCFAAFKFVNNVTEGRCGQCKKYFDKLLAGRVTIFLDDRPLHFCCKTCLNVYVLANRKIIPCGFCKVKKYNFDMIKKSGLNGVAMMCSLTCLKSFEGAGRRGPCDNCGVSCVAQFKTPLAGGLNYFCSFNCALTHKGSSSPSITNVPAMPTVTSTIESPPEMVSVETSTPQIYQHIITKPPEPKEVRNKAVLCKPYMHNKGTSCRPMPCPKATQTDSTLNLQMLVPVPVPIYIPAPLHMYSSPYPVPIPFPLPIPVPIFIPTTRNSIKGIFKEIKKIQEKIPTDPFEAELLMMAEMVAGEKKQEVTDSESEAEGNDAHDTHDANDGTDAADSFSPEAVDTSNTFGEDMLQMALKMASELDEPAVDMESVLTSSTITPSQQPTVDTKALYGGVAAVPEETAHSIAMMRGRKRVLRGGRGGGQQSKRGRRSSGTDHGLGGLPNMGSIANMPPPEMAQPQRIEVEKPDANMRLKYTFGVNAWRHWVMQKNAELEKAMINNRKIKPFKPDLLQLTADELNFSLCLFVKEVKKPNGQEYAPDTIYYLCLGIQQYLFENGRIDNIFTDTYYEKFTDCLDEVAKKFAVLYNDSQYIVTRVEEEHLWESKQLGAHSPHVLLSTLMFFNTKHFNLVTVEEHMQLSFSHIMKHWKRNPNSPGVAKVPGSRNVLLRFYPPQSALEANSRKKKVYEQQENEENPLRCPVKLYEFYLSKCPESVKTRNDVFYLLPERSCVPDSPVWYSTMALGKEPLMKMLHRVKMVKEINVALLTC